MPLATPCPGVDLELLGWPADGPTLRLDHERFAYAGKFVMSDTGKAVVRADGDVVAAASFSPDRTDADVLRIRYVTVRADRRGEGLGPRLAEFVVQRARERGFAEVKIAVNNPYAYEALYRAGFRYTGDRTGIAELVLARHLDETVTRPDDGTATYRAGLERFDERDLTDAERAFVERQLSTGPPAVGDPEDTGC
jgi:GNAT superfamily N-acetyltransferase